jgi:predicted nucleotide-binding protein (sugar kinase/HSP70/actin superfamily)
LYEKEFILFVMSVKLGVARALYSYYHYPQWQRFFEDLECEIVLSPATTKKMLEDGIRNAPAEICLPVKAFLGHIEYLKDKADYILIPRMVCLNAPRSLLHAKRSIKFGCPKAIGLPDMVKSIFNDLPQIIDLVIDERTMTQQQSFLKAGQLFCKDNKLIQDAWRSALLEKNKYESLLLNGIKTSEIFNKDIPDTAFCTHTKNPKVALIGHPYLIYDDLLSHSIFDTITKMGVKVLPVSCVYKSVLNDEIAEFDNIHWLYEQDIIGSTAYFLKQNMVSGVVFAFSFSCGTSAVVSEIINKEILSLYNIPSLTLLFDEHTAQAGMQTRIESFIDLLSRK